MIEAYDQNFEENRTQKCFIIEADRLAAVLFKFGAFFQFNLNSVSDLRHSQTWILDELKVLGNFLLSRLFWNLKQIWKVFSNVSDKIFGYLENA